MCGDDNDAKNYRQSLGEESNAVMQKSNEKAKESSSAFLKSKSP